MIGIRLKEERERLGLTQPAFAELAGAKKRTLIDWEKSVSSPTAVQLSALGNAGVDVTYVLTGQRIKDDVAHMREIAEGIQQNILTANAELCEINSLDIAERNASVYSQRAMDFLKGFASLDEAGKEAIEAMLKALTKR